MFVKLVLFDIDGTLIKGAYKYSSEFYYEKIKSDAIKNIFNIEAKIDWKKVQGMTDQQIIKEILIEANVSTEEIEGNFLHCMNEFVRLFEANIDNFSVYPKPGVKELLNHLTNQGELIGLVTGNIRGNARLKLKKANLWNYFKIGGFGDESENRSDLIKLVIQKAKKINPSLQKGDIVYFGDTPKDIFAGIENDILSIGVATGVYTQEDLLKASANYTLNDLSNLNDVLKIIYKTKRND